MKNIKYHFTQKLFPLFLFLASFTATWAQIPVGYYDDAEGKSERQLKTALHNIIRTGHIELDFSPTNARFWWDNYFRNTDWHPAGHFWCMYSTDTHATYISGTIQNREHAMPRSWWSISTVTGLDYGFANGDLHNLFPANQAANAAKSNFPLGTNNGEIFNNGVSRVGRSTFSGYNGAVFEPPDQYKGDFARTYMYMVTRYEYYADTNRWRSIGITSMLQNNRFPTLTPYAVNLLLAWHRADPVSQKERERNDAVQRIQNNRNPFIDHPELAEHIWGNLMREPWFRNATIAEFGVEYLPGGDMIEILISRHSGEQIRYEIYSITGLRLHSDELPENNKIALSNLNSGMYILVVYARNQRHTARILVGKK